jgi:hypothetical protein
MHIEHFQYDVWSFSEGVQKRLQTILTADIKKQEQDILFDYQKRFVIGHAARTERIQIQDEETNEKGCS